MGGELVVFDGHDDRDEQIAELRADVRRLEADLSVARGEAARVKRDASNALSMLRKQLAPLHRALQAVFGELDAAGVDEGPTGAQAGNPKVSAVWEAWKTRLGGQTAKVIDALLLHGEMNTTQLAIAIGTRRQNIPNLIYKLNQAGLLSKNGGKFSLKPLN